MTQINLYKVGMPGALPSNPRYYPIPDMDTVSNAAFIKAVYLSALQRCDSFDNFPWTERAQREDKFLHEIRSRFPEAQRPTGGDRQVTHGVKDRVRQISVLIWSREMTVPLRWNSLNELRSTGTLSIHIYLKILLL